MADPALACPVCATPPVPGARFCFSCGASLEPDEAHDHGGERRVVTVLFGDLTDFTSWAEDLDPELVKVVTDRVLTSLAATVQNFGGHVDKLTGDGIMAIFGAPTAHEDDAERAVRAASAMQAAVRREVAEVAGGGTRLGLRVGLNTGEVLAGVQAARTYTVVGDTVNTASRLSDAAGNGGVLAGRETALTTLSIASWRALPPMRLKGKREPVAAYELVALRSRTAARLGLGDEAPLIGREAEFGLLVSRLLDVTESRTPGSLLVTGEAGIGKTRLARELGRVAAELPHARVLWGHCSPYGDGRDLEPLVDMVRTACGLDDADDDTVARERVLRTVSRIEHPALGAWSTGLLADRLLALLGLAEDDAPAPRDTATPTDTTTRIDDPVSSLVTFFGALGRQGPLVLVLDDLHWATATLRDTVAQLGARVEGPVLLLALGRSDVLSGGWGDALPDPALLPVAPLEDAAMERLLRAYLGGSALGGELRGALLGRAQGNPFFLAELLHLLVDRGVLRRDGEEWSAEGELPSTVLPAGVQAVLAARIDDLDSGSKSALRDAAVMGAHFQVAALVATGGADEATTTARLRTLVERGIVESDGDPGTYAFVHTLTREVAYAGIPKADRARRHAAVAAWAATDMVGTPVDIDALVGLQAEAAIRLAEEMALPESDPAWSARVPGFESLRRLGRAALRRDDNTTALAVLRRACDLATGLPADDVADVRVAYAAALAECLELEAAYAELVPVLEGAVPGAVRAEGLVVLGDIQRKQRDEDGARAAFAQALAAASECGAERIAGEAIRQLGLLDYFAGRLVEAESSFRQAVELAERIGDDRGLGWALQHLAWSATSRGDYTLADETLERAFAVFASFGDIGGMGWCAGTEAFVRLLQGRLVEARALGQGVLPAAQEARDRWGIAACYTIGALASAELGDVTESLRQAAAAAELWRELNDGWGLPLALIAEGTARRAAGEHAAAVAVLEEAAAAAEQGRTPMSQAMGLVELAWCHYDMRDLDAAEETARVALEVTAGLGLESHADVAVRVLVALISRARGDLDTALKVLDEIVAMEGQPTRLFPMRQAVAHYAGTLLDAGRPVEALAAAERAVTIPAEDVRSRVIAWRALGAARAANGLRAAAEQAYRAALEASHATEHAVERDTTERALAAFLTTA